MTRGWIVLSGWGLLLLALAVIQVVFEPRLIEMVLSAGFGAAMVLVGLLTLAGERRGWAPRPDGDEARLLPWTSASAAALGTGIALLALGWEVGPWLVAVGGGISVFGVGGLVRERRAERKT